MASEPPDGTPRQLLANSRRQVDLMAFICSVVGTGGGAAAGAGGDGATTACFGAAGLAICAGCGGFDVPPAVVKRRRA
jgi:hypothetical protein